MAPVAAGDGPGTVREGHYITGDHGLSCVPGREIGGWAAH